MSPLRTLSLVLSLLAIIAVVNAENKDECLQKMKKQIQEYGTEFKKISDDFSSNTAALDKSFDSKGFNQQVSDLASEYKTFGDSIASMDSKTAIAKGAEITKKRTAITEKLYQNQNYGLLSPTRMILMNYIGRMAQLNLKDLSDNMFDSTACLQKTG